MLTNELEELVDDTGLPLDDLFLCAVYLHQFTKHFPLLTLPASP